MGANKQMDIVATPQTGGREMYVDITYRHALADTHQEGTARDAYFCIKEAESDKATRHAPSEGRSCTAIASLTSGMMSRWSENIMGMLAHTAQSRRALQGLTRKSFLHRWRLELSRHAAAWQSDAVELSISKPHEKSYE